LLDKVQQWERSKNLNEDSFALNEKMSVDYFEHQQKLMDLSIMQ
jgi:hypothetical protein